VFTHDYYLERKQIIKKNLFTRVKEMDEREETEVDGEELQKIYIKGLVWDVVDWIYLAQNRDEVGMF
jgi:hypothetical protein